MIALKTGKTAISWNVFLARKLQIVLSSICLHLLYFSNFKICFFSGPEGPLVLYSLLSQYSSDLVTKYSVGSISISLSHSSSWELCCPISTYFPQQQWRNYLSPSARVYILAMRIIFSFLIHYIILNQSLNSF